MDRACEKFFLLVTDDAYELPLGTFDTVRELAAYLGKSMDVTYSTISHGHRPYVDGKRCRIIRMVECK